LSPQKIIKPHKPIKIEEEIEDDSETDKPQFQICMKKYSFVHSLRIHRNIHNKKFECTICNKKFPTKQHLLRHIRYIHENPGSFKCDVCKVGFNTKENLNAHQKVHMKNRPKPFKCDKCDYATDFKGSLKGHLKAHDKKIERCDKCNRILIKNRIHDCRLDCKYCGLKFNQRKTVAEHIKKFHAHESEKVFYECDICGFKSNHKKCLMTHMKAKYPDEKIQSFTCDFDGKTFKMKKNLGLHIKIHLPRAKCDFCDKKVSVMNLKRHIKKSHSKNYIPKTKIFQCPICSKILSTKSHLIMHISDHNKTIKCKFCEKLFGYQASLKYHIRDYHENPNRVSCETCRRKFSIRSNLKTHMKIHDPNRPRNLKCTQCDYATDNKISFKNHLNFHKKNNIRFALIKTPHKCPQCLAVKGSQKSLNNHIYYVHPKVLIDCDICSRKFKTKKSILRHFKGVHKIGLQRKNAQE